MTDNHSSAATETPLLPCPFCGPGYAVNLVMQANPEGGWLYEVVCQGCSVTMPCDDSEADAISDWNRRASAAQGTLSRSAILEEAARVAEQGCLVPPDGGSPTEDEREMCESIAARIRLLKLKGAEEVFAAQPPGNVDLEAGCGTPGCTDPSCEYGKGPLRCQRCGAVAGNAGVREALELAEDVLSRAPFSTGFWPNGVHPQVGIDKIRDAIRSLDQPQEARKP